MSMYTDQPIHLRDIEVFRQSRGITMADICWLLGISHARWGVIQRDARTNPGYLADPRQALLIRWLAQHPAQTPQLCTAQAGEFFVRLRKVAGNVTGAWFAVALGWDSSAGHRWFRHGATIGPTGRRVLGLIDNPDPAVLADNWQTWTLNALAEASLRGIDLAASGSWVLPNRVMEAAS